MGYKRDIGEVVDGIDNKVTSIQDDVNDVLTVAGKLKTLIDKDEYETDVAIDYAYDVVSKLQDIWGELKKLSDDLY